MGNKLFKSRSHSKYEVNNDFKSDSKRDSDRPVTYIQTEVMTGFISTTTTVSVFPFTAYLSTNLYANCVGIGIKRVNQMKNRKHLTRNHMIEERLRCSVYLVQSL